MLIETELELLILSHPIVNQNPKEWLRELIKDELIQKFHYFRHLSLGVSLINLIGLKLFFKKL